MIAHKIGCYIPWKDVLLEVLCIFWGANDFPGLWSARIETIAVP